MISPLRCTLWLMAGLGVGSLPGSLLLADSQSPPEAAKPASPAVLVPQPPPVTIKSPIDLFRQLLTMSTPEREKYLALRPLEIRKRLEEKLHEYQSMKPDERELRLRATQLRWYVLRLMQSPAVNRTAQISLIPDAADRQFVEYRIQLWDELSPAQQKDLLEYENAIHFTGNDSQLGTNSINGLPQAQRDVLLQKVKNWEALPQEQRNMMSAQFQQFFELTENEKQKALQTLPEPERRQMEKTLKSFALLPKDRREKCIHAFNKFASMSNEERQDFLKNAERWEKMTPSERESWRNLVSRLPAMPPLPPGLGTPPLPGIPSLPRTVRKATPPPLPLVSSDSR
ncbi:DUF3106 domain-containing protein [Pedosphaera parvula]|uniref:DUF3106 domain-containing protein n=1 Tax=Pedosphaera parvula (strain Ellin514) TaxID=320771 RepID=B9XPW6_PEDPL|nr:DUF3106 domain-containing protein [Pedosphaera parvula]EEF58147.1 hypothetical protein Cflav_PD1491 [Pedosphaera parvula Ellin514]